MRFDEPQKPTSRVSQLDVEKICAQEAVYCNKFYIIVQADGMVRIVFADVDGEDKIMNTRFAVVIPAATFPIFVSLMKGNEDNARKVLEMHQKAIAGAKLPAVMPTKPANADEAQNVEQAQ